MYITIDLLQAGVDVKYVDIIRCIAGIFHKQNTKMFAAIIPKKRFNKETKYKCNIQECMIEKYFRLSKFCL